MSITEIGRQGEELARHVIKEYFKCDGLFQADWLFKKDDMWFVVEVKRKERFEPPPFEGHGLNMYQAEWRLEFHRGTNIRCLFLVFDLSDGNIYWQWLDVLEQGQHYDTRNQIRIYPIKNFNKIKGDDQHAISLTVSGSNRTTPES